MAEGAGIVQSGEEEAQVRFSLSVQFPDRGCREEGVCISQVTAIG